MVSILTVVYNIDKYIGECIESVLSQSYKEFEFVIVDDGSTDNTANVIESYNDTRIKFFKCEHKGLSGARNFALEQCTGEYIAIMDGDDVMVQGRLEKQVKFLEQHPNVHVVYGHARRLGYDPKLFKFTGRLPYRVDNGKAGIPIDLLHSSAMIRRSVFTDYNLKYDSEFDLIEDQKLWADILSLGLNITMDTNALVLLQRWHDTNVSKVYSDQHEALYKKMYELYKK